MSEERLQEVWAALGRLAKIDPRTARILELSYFGNHCDRDIAERLGLSERKVERERFMGRLWLRRELG